MGARSDLEALFAAAADRQTARIRRLGRRLSTRTAQRVMARALRAVLDGD